MRVVPGTAATHARRMAWGLVGVSLGGLGGCAHVAAPPGGPPDSIPPILIAVQPDSYAVVPGFRDRVVFRFDEAISERNIQTAVTMYPDGGRPDIDKGKQELKVKPRAGWVADRIYHIHVEPQVQDLFNNRIPNRISHIISTGLPIPENEVRATIFDRINGRPLRGGNLDMIRLPDSLRYGAVADTGGRARLGTLPPGDYLAIGYEDVNGNRRADAFDRADTIRAALTATDTLVTEFRVFRHDTVGPQLATATPIDSLVVELAFDGYLDPESAVDTSNVRLFTLPDSTPLPLLRVLHRWQYTVWRDSVTAAERARADSIAAAEAAAQAAAADTLPGEPPPDTVTPAPLEAAPPAPQAPPDEAQEAEQEEAEEPERLPDRRLYVIAAAAIPSDSIGVRARGIVNLTGLVGGGETTYVQPEREPPEEEEPPGEGDPPPGGESPPARQSPSEGLAAGHAGSTARPIEPWRPR